MTMSNTADGNIVLGGIERSHCYYIQHKGQAVRHLAKTTIQGGTQVVTWDGNDDDGHCLTSFIYLYKLKIDNMLT